ncbi:hypothetical protein [Clostridium estertheticum]|uniref:hypothetical protein n=1 Tax=Clostridium estertheticum TaxID=238834 RepID=UPI001C6F116C|nr:hypothetical protein [Clostridium estertheticum]MBW9154747.1 hypothetical protein [Clostridium estertheticum]
MDKKCKSVSIENPLLVPAFATSIWLCALSLTLYGSLFLHQCKNKHPWGICEGLSELAIIFYIK